MAWNGNLTKESDRFCKAFTGFSKDLAGYESAINSFLKEHPDYRIGCMTFGTTSLGATVLCYFEKKT